MLQAEALAKELKEEIRLTRKRQQFVRAHGDWAPTQYASSPNCQHESNVY